MKTISIFGIMLLSRTS